MKKTFLLLAALIIASAMRAQTFTLEGIKYQITSETTVMVIGQDESQPLVFLPPTIPYNSQSYNLTEIGSGAFFIESLWGTSFFQLVLR